MNSKRPKENIVDISIITINYNLANEVENCLHSLISVLNSQKSFTYEIIIVDNCSPDKKLPYVENKFKDDRIRFFYSDKNLGFGQGNNFGFSKSSGKYVCFLNPDTIIKEEIFSRVMKLFVEDPKFGIIGPKQQVRAPFFDFSAGLSPNVFFELFNLFGVGVFLEGFLIYLYTKFKGKKSLEVNWILGAAIFIKADLFRKINGFDKDYFMFFEEVDLCRRVLKENLKVIYCPQYEIDHIGSVSGKKDYKLYTIRTYSSKKIFIGKHFSPLTKYFLLMLLYFQLISQVIIWTILIPLNKQKSLQKISAFIHLLRNKMKYEHRD
jgi:hypothetical protein